MGLGGAVAKLPLRTCSRAELWASGVIFSRRQRMASMVLRASSSSRYICSYILNCSACKREAKPPWWRAGVGGEQSATTRARCAAKTRDTPPADLAVFCGRSFHAFQQTVDLQRSDAGVMMI